MNDVSSGLRLVGWIVLGFSLLGVPVLILQARKQRARLLTWLTTQGKISVCAIGKEHGTGEDSATLYFVVQLRYEYQVAGERYIGTAIGEATRMHSQRRNAEAEAARYPVGAEVTVHYDPADPASAMLDPRPVEPPWRIALGLAAGVLAGLFFVWLGSKHGRGG